MAAYGVTRHGHFEGKKTVEFVGDVHQRRAQAQARRSYSRSARSVYRLDRDDVQLARERQLPSSVGDPVGYTAAVPLLRDRGLVEGQAAAHVCRDFAWHSPTTEPVRLRMLLEPR